MNGPPPIVGGHRKPPVDFRSVERLRELVTGIALVFFAHVESSTHTYRCSYIHPAANHGGPDKALHTPDVRVLASLAEEAGLDFRVIVLVRSADEILRSTVYHRHFGTEAREATILAASAALLAGQLQLMDPHFFVCVNSSALHKASTWQAQGSGSTTLQELWGINGDAVATVAGYMAAAKEGYEANKRSENPDGEPFNARLSPVTLEHLDAMNHVLFSACGMTP